MEHSIRQEVLKELMNDGGFNLSLAVQGTQGLMAWRRDMYK